MGGKELRVGVDWWWSYRTTMTSEGSAWALKDAYAFLLSKYVKYKASEGLPLIQIQINDLSTVQSKLMFANATKGTSTNYK